LDGSELFAQSPGGISAGLRWWMKADAGVLNNSLTSATATQAVQRWNDQSTVANNANQLTGANQPTFQTGVINGYPVLRFSGNQFLDATSAPSITNSFYFFMVFKQTSFAAGGTADGAGNYVIDRTTGTNELTSFKIVNTDKYMLQKRNNDNSSLGGPISTTPANTTSFVIVDQFRNFATAYGLFVNGKSEGTTGDDSGALTGPTIRLARHNSTANGGLNGDLAEIAVYNSNLSTTDRQQVESYLALKYGITLDQTITTDYLSSAGTTVYPATTTHASFINDIAGIGRDNSSGLNQSASQSQNATSIVRISNPSPALIDGDFLTWGHNSVSISNSSNAPPGYANRLSRIWRVKKTSFTGSVDISFDLTGLGIDVSNAANFALLVNSTTDFSSATAHIIGRTIVGNTVSFMGYNFTELDHFTLASALIPGPGGVGGAVVWLRADKDVYNDAGVTLATNGQTISQWNNQGAATYNVSQSTPANRPTYVANVANSNPVIRFSGGTNFLDFSAMGIGSTSDLDFKLVVRPTSTANAGALGNGSGGYILDRSVSTNGLAGLKLVTPTVFGYQKRNDASGGLGGITTTSNVSTTASQIVEYFRTYNVRYGILYNGALQTTLAESDGPTTLPNVRIGNHQDGVNGLIGDISEVVFYNRTLSTAERNSIDSYLAIKYGVTLDQTSLTNYVSSSGTVVYPATTTHSTYRFDIAGIGQDDVSSLIQTNSQSGNTGSMVKIQSPSTMANNSFMMWGSNNGSVTAPNSVDVGAPILRRLSRVWRIAETGGDVGTVTINIDLTNVPGAKAQADLSLMIDRDGDGFADNDVTPLTGTLAGQIFTITGVNFQNGDFFTVGSTNLATPLPIQLISFSAQADKSVVRTAWATATEKNNAFFTLERSFDGQEFEEVARMDGAGDSQSRLDYRYVDLNPHQALSYYRLKQTDFDGAFTYSEVRSVLVDPLQSTELVVYPNPTKANNFTIRYAATEEGEAVIELFSSTGQRLYQETQIEMRKGFNEWAVNPINFLLPGIYLVRVKTKDKVISTKLAVE